jgi:hypothetical protein
MENFLTRIIQSYPRFTVKIKSSKRLIALFSHPPKEGSACQGIKVEIGIELDKNSAHEPN